MVQFANPPTQGKEEDEEAITEMPALSSSEEGAANGSSKRKSDDEGHGKKRKRKSKSEKGSKVNGVKRRHSVSKPARDPRDEASSPRSKKELVGTRSPSPVIDFDGLSRPSKALVLLVWLHD